MRQHGPSHTGNEVDDPKIFGMIQKYSEEEDKLDREARAPGTDSRNIWNDPVEKTGWSERGRELHQPMDLALPEESTSWL